MTYGPGTHPYVAKMIAGWPTDQPKDGLANHNWMLSQYVRRAYRCASPAERTKRSARPERRPENRR
jgi:hypothetical protein